LIKLKSLELQGFRRFTDLTHIDFPESGLLLLDGDSGSGKSTVLQGIAYALDICPFPSTSLKSWTGEKLQVQLTLLQDDKEIIIRRGTENSIQFNGEPPRTGAKALEEGLRGLFGMPGDLLSALTYRPQDTLGLFLSKSDPEKKEFLAKVLGLEAIESLIEDAQVNKKDLQAKIQFAEGVLAERESRLKAVLDQLDTEVSPDPSTVHLKAKVQSCNDVISCLELEVNSIELISKGFHENFLKECEEQKEGQRLKLQQAKKFHQQFKDSNAEGRIAFDKKFSNLKDQVHQTDNELRKLDTARQEIKKLTQEVDSLKANKCWVCHQTFTAELAIDQKINAIEGLSSELEADPLLRKRRTDLLALIADLKYTPDEREGKFAVLIGQIENDIKNLGKSITDTRWIAIQEEVNKGRNKLSKAKQELASAKFELTQAVNEIEGKNKRRLLAENNKSLAEAGVESQKSEVKSLLAKYHAECDFLQVLGREGFLGVIFDEVLTEISKQANDILGKLSNTSSISVHFRSESLKGKKTIVPVFVVSGHETTRSSGLSGGQGTSADLAVDLGVVAVVESRLGDAPAFLLLDECFNGLPRGTKESALEILQGYSQTRLILVVDHGSELRESFQSILKISLTDEGKSFITTA